MRTNWRRCFSALVAVLLALSAAAPAAAVSAADSTGPESAAVGSEVEATATLTELYERPNWESWRLAGETELKRAVWTVTLYDQTGAKVDQRSFDGAEFSAATVAVADGTSEVRVTVSGTVPPVADYSYEPAQSATLFSLSQVRDGGASNELLARSVRPYTAASADARERLDDASAAVASADAGGDAAESLDRAVSAYESGNFELAATLAGEAESRAAGAERRERTRRLALYGAGGVVSLALLIGGLFLYRSRRNAYDRLG